MNKHDQIIKMILNAIKNGDVSIVSDMFDKKYTIVTHDNTKISFVLWKGYNIKKLLVNDKEVISIPGNTLQYSQQELDDAELIFNAFLEREKAINQEAERQRIISYRINQSLLEEILSLIKQGKANIQNSSAGVTGTIVLSNGMKITCMKFHDYDMTTLSVNGIELMNLQQASRKYYDPASIQITETVRNAIMDVHNQRQAEIHRQECEKTNQLTPEQIAARRARHDKAMEVLRKLCMDNENGK